MKPVKYHGFKNCGDWYKGNLHSHTTVSDGMLTPEQAVALYRNHGYHFLCFSEHDIYSDYGDQFNSDNFILLPGIECSAILYCEKGTNARYKVHHLHGILGTKSMQEEAVGKSGLLTHMQYVPPIKFFKQWNGAVSAQQIADQMQDHGCVVTYNHPIWSRVTEEEFIHTQGVQALEIFNFNTVQEAGVGYDVTYWDQMLRMGKRINGFASDDNHNEGVFEDSCGGWICIQAPRLDQESIVQNFLDGNYYSSSGPQIYDWGIMDGRVWIDCSAVNRIHFICGNQINDGIAVLGERFQDSLSHGEHTLKGHEAYVRVEVVDKFGCAAWTNPIYLDGETED